MTKTKNVIILALIVSVLLTSVGCDSEKKKAEVLEQQVQELLAKSELQLEDGNINEAIVVYEEVFNLTENPEYQAKIDELKAEQEELQKKQEKIDNDIALVNQIIDELKGILFNPNSLQVNEVIIYRHDEIGWATVYMDYSAMNKMGGYARDYAYGAFTNEALKGDSFFPSFESNYRSAKKDIDGESAYYFDIELLK